MKSYRKTPKAALTILLALFCLLAPATAPANEICVSNNPDEIPPFLTTGVVDPNLLLIIDNSASMYDLAYIDDARYCFDDSYNPTDPYAGYFSRDAWYVYLAGAGGFAAISAEQATTQCDSANRKKTHADSNHICLTLGGDGAFASLAAKGNFLNWATASKLDIEKGILTGGKYASGDLIMESRGCLERRFIKQTPFDDPNYFLTLAVRPPKAVELSADSSMTTQIELFPATSGGYNHEACQEAVNMINEGNLGQLGQKVQECMGYSPGGGQQTLSSASQTAFNHSLQDCWYLAKHQVWPPGAGSVTRITNDCESVYDHIQPIEISTDHSGYVCFGNHDADPDAPLYLRGYVGRCWDTGGAVTCVDVPCTGAATGNPRCVDGYLYECLGSYNAQQGRCTGNPGEWVRLQNCTTTGTGEIGWNPAEDPDKYSCIDQALQDYCGMLSIPEVVDPSDQVTGTGDNTEEFWNIPAVLVDSGVQGQLGEPLAIMKARIAWPEAEAPAGLLQEFVTDLRIGAMTFNRDGAESECLQTDPYVSYNCADPDIRDGGRIITSIGKGQEHTQALVDAINDIVADTWTPLAESMYNALGYYRQDQNMRLSTSDFAIGPDPVTAWCQMNNILLITDGASTADQNPVMMAFAESLGYPLNSGTCEALHGSTYLDDLAYFAQNHLWDNMSFPLESDPRQNISTHIVAAGSFRDAGTDKCSPNVLLSEAATSGGTTLYQAENLNELEPMLREAFRNIRAGAAAGSAASVISATRSGEGAVYQAIFWPEKYDQIGNMITWAGEVQALFVDARGRLYEDTNRNRRLDAEDQPVAIFHDPILNSSRACIGVLTDDTCDGEVKDIAEVNYLWSANGWLGEVADGAILANRSAGQFITDASRRYIFTWNDRSGDGLVGATEVIPFEAATITGLGPEVYQDLQVSDAAEAQSVINWVRGLDQAGLRSRRLQTAAGEITWRLGDVVHSTPTVVSRPAEGYHFLYRHPTYAAFANRYNHRRHMIYFGGNDGMLHAVNGGFFNPNLKKFCLTANCDDEAGAMPLGAEMWAYLPYNLWPHLKCLSDPEYGHKYYVDLVPRIFDVQIFDPNDPNHPGGWGTIMVGGMRFGGEKIAANGKLFNSAFFILDITNPEAPPKLLAEMTFTGSEAEMGFTTAVPTMVPMVAGEVSEWYLVLGSGPTNFKGESDQTGRVAVISLRELIKGEIPFRLPATPPTEAGPQVGSFPLSGHANSFASDLITVDFDLNFLADSVYFGTVSGGFQEGWGGKVYRLVTAKHNNGSQVPSQPHEWPGLLTQNPLPLIDVGQPVTAAPSAAWDGSNYWIYFGTGRLYNRLDYDDDNIYTYYGIKEPWNCPLDRFSWATVERKDTDANSYGGTPGQRGLLRVDQIEVLSNFSAAGALLECRDDEANNCLPPEVTNFQQLRYYITGFGCQSDQTGTDGWYRQFHAAGERNLGQATLLGGLLTYSAYLPSDDVCQPEGFSDLYALFYQTGTAWHRPVFSRFQEPGGVRVQYQQRIGPGLAITPSLHVGTDTGAKAFLQTSTGAIVGIEQPELPFSEFRTGRESWREIYRQIFNEGE